MMRIIRNLVRSLAVVFAVAAHAEICELCTYEVTADNIVKYVEESKKNDTTEIFEILNKYIDWRSNTREELLALVASDIHDYPQFSRTINNFISGDAAVTEMKRSSIWGDSLIEKIWIDSIGMSKLKQKIVQDINDDSFSTPTLNLLTSLQGIRFIDSLPARHYAVSLLALSLGICIDTANAIDLFDSVVWDNKEIDAFYDLIKQKLPMLDQEQQNKTGKSGAKRNEPRKLTPDEIIKFLKWYQGLSCSDERWYRAFTLLDTLYMKMQERSVNKAMQIEIAFDDSKPIVWNDNGCGCSLQDQLNGEVIGIYPYWLAGDTTKWIDFSALTRISFFSLYADAEGLLHMPSGMPALAYLNKKGFSNFVATAHRHYVKMDWIVTKSNWSTYKTPEQLETFFSNLSNEIDSLVSEKNNSLFQRIVNHLSFSGDDNGFRGDGVTLYFKNYPTDSASTAIFNEFFKNLHKRMRAKNPDAQLNMMADRIELSKDIYSFRNDSITTDISRGIYTYKNFRKIITEPESENGVKPPIEEIIDSLSNRILVINEEPFSRSNRLLHNDLSLRLKGDDRHIIRKALAPVIWLNRIQWDQLSDDISYYNDTYYGMGIAPFFTDMDAANLCGSSGNIGTCINKFYKKDDIDITFNSQVREAVPFFCMYRWIFRLLNTLVYAIVIMLLLAYFISCTASAFFDKHLALFVGVVILPPALTTTILMFFDPVTATLSSAIRFLPIVILLLSVIAVSLLKVYQSTDLPKRNIK